MKTKYLKKTLFLFMLCFSLLSCKERMKTVGSFKLNSELTTAYSTMYPKENRNHTNFMYTDKVNLDAQAEDVIKILKVADQRAKNYKKQLPKYAWFIIEDVALIESIIEVELEGYTFE